MRGITNVNLDLIAGLPGQTRASWEASLDWIEQLAPPHVSIYLFEMDEDSHLGREALLGGVRYGAALLPRDDEWRSFTNALCTASDEWDCALRDLQFRAAGL